MEKKSGNKAILADMSNALIALSKEKPIAKVTITELTEKAGVSRMAYHRNYESHRDLLAKYIESLMDQYRREVTAREGFASYIRYENVLLALEFVKDHRDLIICLSENGMESLLYSAFQRHELNLSLNSTKHWKDCYNSIAFASAVAGCCFNWIGHGMKESPNELAQLLCDGFQDKLRRY